MKALAGSEEITLDPADYTLVCDTEIRNAGTYSVGIQLKTGNYVNPNDCKDTYTVTKATLSGVALDQTSSVYDQEAVDPAMLTATVRATCESGEIILPARGLHAHLRGAHPERGRVYHRRCAGGHRQLCCKR